MVLKFNRSLATSIALGFLIINIIDKNIRLKYNDCNESVVNAQIGSSVLTLTATLIVLFLAFTSNTNYENLENPNL